MSFHPLRAIPPGFHGLMMTRPTVRRCLLSIALAAALAGPAHAQNYEAFEVADIRVEGLQRISAGTVKRAFTAFMASMLLTRTS